mmetsp:Transcript_37301/g.107094  ORF Transcript_37301/g.107094 Transcript_37301/m.107094 type:complete len:338 (+) Transcript_37301:525-1538(+)
MWITTRVSAPLTVQSKRHASSNAPCTSSGPSPPPPVALMPATKSRKSPTTFVNGRVSMRGVSQWSLYPTKANCNCIDGKRALISCTIQLIWFFTARMCPPMEPVQSTMKHTFRRSACSYTLITRLMSSMRRRAKSPSDERLGCDCGRASATSSAPTAPSEAPKWSWSPKHGSERRRRTPHCSHSCSAKAHAMRWSCTFALGPDHLQPRAASGQRTHSRPKMVKIGRCGGEVRAKGCLSNGHRPPLTQRRQSMWPPGHPSTTGSTGQPKQTLHCRSLSGTSSGGTYSRSSGGGTRRQGATFDDGERERFAFSSTAPETKAEAPPEHAENTPSMASRFL